MKPSHARLFSVSRWSGRRLPIAALAVAAACSALLAAGCGGGSSGAKVAQVGSTEATTTAAGENAQQACRKLLPNGGVPTARELAKQMKQALGYAACMRGHGVPKFPDPKASSDGAIEWGVGPPAGVDPNGPQFKAALKMCNELVPGAHAPLGPGGGRKP
jgi:hypothetical protein